jgi:hypothetical protein
MEQMRTEGVLRMILLHGWEQIRRKNAAPSLIARDHQGPRLILVQVIANSDLHGQPFTAGHFSMNSGRS